MKMILPLSLLLIWSSTACAIASDAARVAGDVKVNGIHFSDNSTIASSNNILRDKGPWSSGAAYSAGDIVQSQGSSYVCATANTNISPPNSSYWSLLAAQGPKGDPGSAGSLTLATICGAIAAESPPIPTYCSNYATLKSIAIAPPNPSAGVGATTQLTANGTFNDSSVRNLTTAVTWSSLNTPVATISNTPGTIGLATVVSQGTATITATAAGNISGSTTLTGTAASGLAVLFTLNAVSEKCIDYSASAYASQLIAGQMLTHTGSGGSPSQVASCDGASPKLLGTCNVASGQGGITYYYESQAYRHVAVGEQECIPKSGVWAAGPNYPGTWWPLNCENDVFPSEGTVCSTYTGPTWRTISAGNCNGSVTNPSSAGYYTLASCPSTVPGVGDKKGTCTFKVGQADEWSTTYYKNDVCVYFGQCNAQTPIGTCTASGGTWSP